LKCTGTGTGKLGVLYWAGPSVLKVVLLAAGFSTMQFSDESIMQISTKRQYNYKAIQGSISRIMIDSIYSIMIAMYIRQIQIYSPFLSPSPKTYT